TRLNACRIISPYRETEGRLKGSVAFAQEYGDTRNGVIRSSHIQEAVSVVVSQRNPPGRSAGRVRHGSLKRAIPIAQQNTDRGGSPICGHEILLVNPTPQICHMNIARVRPNRIINGGSEMT